MKLSKNLPFTAVLLVIIIGALTLGYGTFGLFNTNINTLNNIASALVGFVMVIGGIALFRYLPEDNKHPDIVITERASDLHACIRGHPELWGCGRTYAEAIGNVINSHREEFNIKIEYPKQEKKL